ncbi:MULTISPECIES: dynamin family protein [Rhodococcus]|uniref:dynamin family protein n=1 Tax=Rhodococcus TaxID=1827 RepID=UPI002952CF42|nr:MULTISPECIES: dynamin family protein [Rhodococcus]MDV7246243.1 dynamin family protein [Rhodococcus oxybenzonivorans]MDV7337285.1 dynamin family protein [Rhodococcus oxybenzonivorans]MDV8030727.1 dynamin family protein [Rhodococcus sp. IEGM 27]
MESAARAGQPADDPSPAAPAPPRERAEVLLTSITGKVLRPFGYDAISDLAEQRAASMGQTRSVVVVGEVKRGKSSLVNALVGWRDASPVGVDVTTSTTISFGEATPEQPGGTAQILFPDRTEQIPHADLADWVSCEGAHVTDARAQELPTRAIVPVPGSRLGDVTVIDTPGVGGLDPSYAVLAEASASQACVLVIVCDASTPLTAPEMAFIERTGSAVESLIVVVTKTDKNIRRWRLIVEEDRELLARHLGRQVPVVGVSSLRAVIAAEMPPGPDRDAAEVRSGITELRELIGAKLGIAEHLPAITGLRTAAEGLAALAADMRTQIGAITRSGEVIPDLTAQLAQLQSLKDHSAQWEQYLQRDLTLIRQHATDDLDRSLDGIREKWTTRINKNGMAVLRRNPQHFTAEMERDFQAAMAGAVNLFLEQLYTQIVQPRFASEVIWHEISEKVLATLSNRTLDTHQVAGKRQGLLDPSMITMGVMGSSMLGGLIGVSAMMGVGAVVGVAWVGFNLGFKAMRAGKTNLLAWLRETIATTKTTTARMLESTLALARPEIVIRYREHVKTSIETLQKQIKDAEDTARTDKATREKKLTRLENNLRVVENNITRAEALITELSTPAPPSAMGGGVR